MNCASFIILPVGTDDFTEPVGYLDFMKLQMNARFILTDSGGIQEESTYFGVPCLTLRENTERPITITEGTNRLVPLDILSIIKYSEEILAGKVIECRWHLKMVHDGT